MKEMQSVILQHRGSHYQLGKKQGENLKHSSLFAKHRQQLSSGKRPGIMVDVRKAQMLLKQISPLLWEELEGLAEGLELTMDETVALYSGYQQEWIKSGCSIMTTPDVLVRNYDFHPKTYEGRFVVSEPEKGYASIGPAQRITGRTDGMNEKGLVIGYNFVNRRRGGDGFIPTVILRMLLETCASSEEAVDAIKNIPHRHTFNFVIYDAEGSSFVVEASPRNVSVRKSNYCTNHFDILTEDNRHHMSDSLRRIAILKEKSVRNLTAEELFQLFNQKKHAIYSEEYSHWAGTIHTSLYLPKQQEMWFAIGADKFPLVLSFSDWMKGTDFPYKRIRGELNTNEPLSVSSS